MPHRPRNPLNPHRKFLAFQNSKPPEEFTGNGEEHITGEGGGILRFVDGKFISSHPVPMAKKWTHEETARMLALNGRLKIEPESSLHFNSEIPKHVTELLRNPDLAEFAAEMIFSAHRGDFQAFRRIAEIVKQPVAKIEIDPVLMAVTDAAHAAQSIPTREAVRDILASIPGSNGTGKRFPNVHESDKLKDMLKKIGFEWLPGRKQGEHLRRNTP